MKDIRLLQLELTNYRNIEHEVYVFNGKNAKIVGENRIGKTNTLEAIYFLLTNYLLDGSSDLTQLKPLNDTKKVVSVKGTFDVDGRTLTLEKRYAEEWVKTRGTNDLVLKGHYETYIFNDIEQDKSGDYYNLLEEYFGIRNDRKGELDVIQLLCNPLYLGNLGDSKDWTTLRAFIIKLIGDVTDDEVFAKEPTTMLIRDDLEKALGKTEQVKKLYDNDIKGLNTAINGYDANVMLLEKTSRPTDEDLAIARKGIEDSTQEINKLMSSLDSNDVVTGLEKRVFEVKQAVLELNTKEYSAWQSSQTKGDYSKVDELKGKLETLLEEATELKFKVSNLQGTKRMCEVHIDVCTGNRERFAKEYTDIKNQMADVDKHVITECPTCHKPFTEEELDEARKTYLGGLEDKLNYIVEEGKTNTEELNKYKEQLITVEQEIAVVEQQLADKNKEIDALKEDITKEKDNLAQVEEGKPFEESDELKTLRKKLGSLELELETAKADDGKRRADIYVEIETHKDNLVKFNKIVSDYDYYCRQMQTLEEVKERRKETCKTLADIEQKKECLDLFNYTKLRLLDTHVANVFGNIKFQLIRENINGGFDPVCKPYIYDIEKGESTATIWKSGSKSEKIVTGIAIAEAIKSKLNLSDVPFLFDEGGEISSDTLFNRLKTQAQIICVKVEDNINKPVVVNF